MRIKLNPFHLTCTNEQAWEYDNHSTGFCISCGEEWEGYCEPDAANYFCETCGEHKLFGFMELVMMDLVTITE